MDQVDSYSSGAADSVALADAWETFVNARKADVFCQSWLGLMCGRIEGVQAAAILVEDAGSGSFVPIAAWPDAHPDLARLTAVIEQALREGRGVVLPPEGQTSTRHLAYPVFVDKKIVAVVALDLQCGGDQVSEILRELHWGGAWLANMLSRRELDSIIEAKERINSVLETVAVALRHKKFRQALFEVANDLRRHFNCSRVAIGLAKHSNIRLMAISEAATFGKNAPLSKAYIRAMEEVYDLSRPIEDTSIQPDKENTAISPSNPGHQALRAVSGAAHVLSVPMMQHARCVGVITLERPEGEGFDPSVHAWFDAFSALAAPIVEQRTIAERSVPVRLIDNFKSLVEKLFGPGYLVWKAAAAILVLLMAILILVPVDYRVTSRTVIEGKSQVMVSAPFDGFIGAAYVRAGDTVRKGQPLLQLNDRELRIEEAKWASERDQYSNRLREAMAKHDLTGVQVIGAQLRQAEAQLALVTDKIVYAHVVAPFDGIVVSGDLSQKIGAPVEIGKKLFEIAPLHRYRVIIQVDEREIRHIRVGETGQIVITGIAADPLPITVAKVTPVAIAQDGENFFRVEATLSRSDPRLRPGMEGVAKIGVGRRQLWWVVTHSFTDWLRLQLWSWLP